MTYTKLCEKLGTSDGKEVAKKLSGEHGIFIFVPRTPRILCEICGRLSRDNRCHEEAIYGLVDPRNNKICYVGRTAVGLKERLQAHYGEASREPQRPKNQWLKELRAAGFRATILLLETTTIELASEAERKWINKLIEQGAMLLNIMKVSR